MNMQLSFEHILRKACRAINPKNVLEWGPGESTRMIAEECPGAQILSMEHSQKWVNKFNENPLSNVTIVHRHLDLRGGTSMGYITWPLYLRENGGVEKFDLIFIDGRFRFDCLMIARYLLAEGGCVIMHDSHRKAYHPPFKVYTHSQNYPKYRTAIMSDTPLENFDDTKSTWHTALSREITLNTILLKLISGDSFYHVRFGDAEIVCTENPLFANKRHQPRDDKLSLELVEALRIDHPQYQIACTMEGWNSGKLRRLRRILSKYFHRKTFYHVTFLHETFLKDFSEFLKFTRLFKDKKVLLIGGPTVVRSPVVKEAFHVTNGIKLSDTNAYYDLDENMERIINRVKSHDITICALGWASTVLAKRLWRLKIRNIQFIDIGSTVDALAGVKTRSWITKNWDYIQEKRKCFL